VLDKNTFDWKIFVLNEVEAKEKGIVTAEDYEKHNPHKLNKIMNWFNKYKMSQFGEDNALLLGSKILSVDETLEVIKGGNKMYKDLIAGKRISRDYLWINSNQS